YSQLVVPVCLRGGGESKQIEGAALGLGGGGEDGGEVIASEADDIAGERGEIAEQGMETVHRQRFAICWVGAFARGLALRRRGGHGLGHRRVRRAARPAGSGSSNSIGARLRRMCHCR